MGNANNTSQELQKSVSKLIVKDLKSEYISKSEIIRMVFTGSDSFGSVAVDIPSTCGVGETMQRKYIYSYEESNIDCFTEVERLQFPHLITEAKLEIKAI